MSIERISHDYRFGETTFEVICDDCGETEEIEGSFEDCIGFMKDEQWGRKYEGGDWVNLCPKCKGK